MALFEPSLIPALDTDGNTISGATLTFNLTDTSTAKAVYSDAGMSVSLGSVVTADSAGRFVAIYYDPSYQLRAILKDAGGAVIWDVDPATPAVEVIAGTIQATAATTLTVAGGSVTAGQRFIVSCTSAGNVTFTLGGTAVTLDFYEGTSELPFAVTAVTAATATAVYTNLVADDTAYTTATLLTAGAAAITAGKAVLVRVVAPGSLTFTLKNGGTVAWIINSAGYALLDLSATQLVSLTATATVWSLA